MSAYDHRYDSDRSTITLWVSCPGKPRQKSELNGHRFLLGRGLDCDVVLGDSAASREHAVLLRDGDSWLIRDLDSTNGLFYMGRRQGEISLSDGDEIQIGGSVLRFSITPEPAFAPAGPTVVRKQGGSGGKLVHRQLGAGAPPKTTNAPPGTKRWGRLMLFGGASGVLALVLIWGITGLSSKRPPGKQAVRPNSVPPRIASTDAAGEEKPPNPSNKNHILSLRHLEKGGVFLQAGRLPDAVREFSHAVELDPGNNLARIKLQKTRQKQQEAAQQSFERGMVNFKFLNYELAAQEWRRVLNLVPDPNDPLHRKALDSLDKVRKKLGH